MMFIVLGMILSTLGCVEKPEQKTEMVLNNYPELFEKDVIIVIGEKITPEMESNKSEEGNSTIANDSYNVANTTKNIISIPLEKPPFIKD